MGGRYIWLTPVSVPYRFCDLGQVSHIFQFSGFTCLQWKRTIHLQIVEKFAPHTVSVLKSVAPTQGRGQRKGNYCVLGKCKARGNTQVYTQMGVRGEYIFTLTWYGSASRLPLTGRKGSHILEAGPKEMASQERRAGRE